MPDVTITPTEDGPYQVSGPVRLADVDGREIPHPDPMNLCRCGQCVASLGVVSNVSITTARWSVSVAHPSRCPSLTSQTRGTLAGARQAAAG